MQGLPVEIADGNIVTVPASLDYLSTYVLLEQEDWFEKELPFVRSLLKPGMRAIDIGANYGVYSVGMGKAVGPAGRVWAFEPAHATFRFLRYTLARNGLTQVEAEDCALSDRAGHARLSTQENSELNSLVLAAAASGSEEVRIDSLDGAVARRGIRGVDFVKLDAEGEEANIIAGGGEFFRVEDPLVMFELKHGDLVDTTLLARLRTNGYRIFRLVGPPSLLVPVEDESTLDSFELNLFACKPTRAAQLEQRGLLLTTEPAPVDGDAADGIACFRRQPFAAAWRRGRTPAPALRDALNAYALWRDERESPARRYGALLRGLRRLESEAQRAPGIELLTLLARMAQAAGGRARAVAVIDALLPQAMQDGVEIVAPTWPAAARFDSIAVASDLVTWLVAAAAEARIVWSALSGYFSGANMLPLLNLLQSSPYASAAMERRRQLQQLQAGRTNSIEASAHLSKTAPAHRNAEFWRRAAAERTTMPASLLIRLPD